MAERIPGVTFRLIGFAAGDYFHSIRALEAHAREAA
jgi:hypothetical protein